MPSATVQRNIITNPEQLRKNVRRCMRKLLDKNLVSSDPNVNAERQIEFAWSLVDWRTFDPSSPLKTFPGDAANKEPSALELLILALKNSPSAEVHYASSSAIAYLAVRQDIRLALVETPSGPLMESLDLLIRRLEATEHSGLRYAICAIATELCKTEIGLIRLRDINFAQALERLRQKKIQPKDAALELIMDHLSLELRPRIS